MSLTPQAKEAFRAAVKEVDGINAVEIEHLRKELDEAHQIICNVVGTLNQQVIEEPMTGHWIKARLWLIAYADRRASVSEGESPQ